jgi:AP2 domain
MREIPLSNSNLVALVDDEDHHFLSRITWCLKSNGYAGNTKFGNMHVLIMGSRTDGLETDHIDRNKLNNQKTNLRRVSRQMNVLNVGIKSNNTSGFRGVVKVRRDCRLSNPWAARIDMRMEGRKKSLHLGYFATAEEAARAYDAKARELHGEYAYQNFSGEGSNPDEGSPQ